MFERIVIIILFGLLPYLSSQSYVDRYELIKAVSFLCVSNVFVAVALMLPGKTYNVKLSILDKLLLALFGWQVLVSILGRDVISSIFGQYYRYQGIVTMVCYLQIYYLVSRKFSILKNFNWIIAGSGILNSVFLVGQWVALRWFEMPIYNVFGRLSGNMGNPNFAGAFVALSFAYCKNIWLFPIYLIGVLLTDSRGSLIVLGLILVGKSYWLVKNKVRFGLLVGLVGILLVLIYPQRPKSLFEDRTLIWRHAIEAITKRPISGWGVENFSLAFESTLKENDFDLKNIRVDKAHNELLEITTASGLIGGGLYLWLLYILFRSLLKNLNHVWAQDNLLALIGFVLISMTNVVSLNTYLFFYLIAGIVSQKVFCKSRNSARQE